MIMSGQDHTASDVFRAHGALVWVAHGESHPIEQLRDVNADGTEIYNLHANIDPSIRQTYLGEDAIAPLTQLGAAGFWGSRADGPEPDLALLAFIEENPKELALAEALWAEGRHLTTTLGSDVHENAISTKLRDGERGDSYRRVFRWFSNHVLADEASPAAIKAALRAGRAFGAFELLGSPSGFDYHAEPAGEMGDTVAAGATLVLSAPLTTDPVRLRIVRVDAQGSTEVASQHGGSLRLAAAQPGAYRAEVRVTPQHLQPYMGTARSALLHEQVWIYANPIYVR
jgi:hypothetical protein